MLSVRPRHVLALLASVAAVVLFTAGTANASIPFGQTMTGKATYYDDAGYGACGTQINAATENLVAVSYQWWTTANPNNDPLCQNVSVQVTYNGITVTVPVKDKCPSCDSTHIDLSKPVFQRFASTDVGVLNGITWKFVNGSGSGGSGAKTGAITGLASKCVDVAAANPNDGTQIQLYTCNGTNAQQWTFPGDGSIQALGKCLDIASGGTTNGTRVQLYTCNGTGAQQWQYTSGNLVNPQSNKCLDVTGVNSADGTPLQIWDCNGGANQQWTIPA